MIEFAKFTDDEQNAVKRIIERASDMLRSRQTTPLEFRMDLAAIHTHTPLDLGVFADGDDLNFNHDVDGILYHIDRGTGKLTGCFVPRFAA